MKNKKLIAVLMTAAMMSALGMSAQAETNPKLIDIGNVMIGGDMAQKETPKACAAISADEAGQMDRSMRAYNPTETILVNNAETFYYYEQLAPAPQEIYDVMMMIAEDPNAEGNIGVIYTDLDPNGEEFFFDYGIAYQAMTYDHPELFWLYSNSRTYIGFFSTGEKNADGQYEVYFGVGEEYPEFEKEVTAFNEAAEAFLADIDTSGSEYDTAKQIHDKLCDLVTYDHPVCDGGMAQGKNVAHTAYGALVCDNEGNANWAVCDGYSLAFEYLCQQVGIEATCVAGDAGGDSSSLGGHCWNVVKLDGQWYESDATWDDMGTLIGQFSETDQVYPYLKAALDDPEYMEKISHYQFLLSTEEFRSYEGRDSYYDFTFDDGAVLNLALPGMHLRWSDDGSMDIYNADPAVISMAPVAVSSYAR